MKPLSLAATCGTLLFVAALNAQTPLQPAADPGFSRPGPTPPAYRDPQPADRPEFDEGSTVQPGNVPHDPKPATPDEFAKYPIWLLIKPGGIRFLQTREEIAMDRNAIPPDAFLLGCVTVKFEGAAGEQKPDFKLDCDDFLLLGRFGTQKHLEVKGAALSFATKSQQIQFKGSEALPLEIHSIDAVSESRMRAEEVILQLDSGSRTVTKYETGIVVDPTTGRQSMVNVPVYEQRGTGKSSFQLSARNITALQIDVKPAPPGDAPSWNPDAPQPGNVPLYDDSSSGSLKPVPEIFPGDS